MTREIVWKRESDRDSGMGREFKPEQHIKHMHQPLGQGTN